MKTRFDEEQISRYGLKRNQYSQLTKYFNRIFLSGWYLKHSLLTETLSIRPRVALVTLTLVTLTTTMLWTLFITQLISHTIESISMVTIFTNTTTLTTIGFDVTFHTFILYSTNDNENRYLISFLK